MTNTRATSWARRLHLLAACAVSGLSVAAVAQELGPFPQSADVSPTDKTSRADDLRAAAELERQPLGMPSKTPARSAQASSTPSGSQNPASLSGLVRTVLSLAGVVAIIVGSAYGFKRLARGSGGLMNQLGAGGRAPSGVLSILGRYPVARGTTLVLLKVDRRVLLLCQTAGKGFTAGSTMDTLTEFTDPEDVASILLKTRDEEEATLAQRFESILSREDDAASRVLDRGSPSAKPAASKPVQSRAARAASRQPEAVLRPTPVPSDPRAQIARESQRLSPRTEPVANSGVKPSATGPLLRGVVA